MLRSTLIITLLVISGLFAQGNNPADQAASYGLGSTYFKVNHDGGVGGCRFFLMQTGIGKNMSVSVLDFSNYNGTSNSMELTMVLRPLSYLDIALSTSFAGTGLSQNLYTTLKYGVIGFSLKTPLTVKEFSQLGLGPQLRLFHFAGFITMDGKGENPGYGITYYGKGPRVDIAYLTANKTYYLRAAKGINTKIGTFIPELRLRFKNNDPFYGLGVGFIPAN